MLEMWYCRVACVHPLSLYPLNFSSLTSNEKLSAVTSAVTSRMPTTSGTGVPNDSSFW